MRPPASSPSRPSRHPTTLFGAVVLMLSALAAPAHGQGQGRAVPVEAAKVAVEPVVRDVVAVGSLRANKSIVVRPEIAGVILSVDVRETQRVEKGALLFTLDNHIYRAELERAEASLRLSERNYDRAAQLFGKGAATAQLRDEALSKVQIDRAALNLAKTRLAKTRLYAPFAGVVGLTQIDVGAYVNVGQDLITLDDIDVLKIDFELPERLLRFIKPGLKVSVTLDALPGESFDGELTAIGTRVNPAGRSLSVRAKLPNPNRRLKPGLFARISVTIDTRSEAIVIPEEAILPRGREFFVYRVVDGKARLTKVTIGLRRYGRVEIVKGLGKDDVIVVAGHLKLADGVAVRPVQPKGG